MPDSPAVDVLFYISNRRVGVIRPDGSGECYPRFDRPAQVYWQLGYLFPNGREAVLWSQEPPRNPDAPFDHPDGLGNARTHLWRCDLESGAMVELNLPTSATVIGLTPEGRGLLVMENDRRTAAVVRTDLEGGGREVLFSSPGYAYGASLSRDGRQVAFHIVGAPGGNGYEIRVLDCPSGQARLIAGDPAWLHFGPTFSPDGQWLLYQRCDHRQDPGHDRSDLCLSRVDGSEHRLLTQGQSHWFAAAYGTPERHSSGSNGPAWSPDGRGILASLLLPDSQTAWPYRRGQPDLDHFNRDYRPHQARGGTRLCLLNPHDGSVTPLSDDQPPTWHCRPTWSPDGQRIAVARVDVGCQPELWVMAANGSGARKLTRGLDGAGADHFRWVRLTAAAAARLT